MNTATARKQPAFTLQHYLGQAGVREDLPWARAITMNPEMMPMKHQVTGLNQILAHDRFGLYDQVGTGKSIIMQATALYYAGYDNKIVILMPPVLLEQFEESLDHTFWGWRDQFTFHVLNEGPAERAKLFKRWRETEWPDMMAMSYQQFAKFPRQRKKKNGDVVPPNNDDYIVGVLKQAGYCYVIADEAQALKNPGSNNHKAVKYLAEEGGLLLATGTPISNTLVDAYGMIDLVTPGKYASKRSFERLHCVYSTNDSGWSTLIGFQNTDVLTTHLYSSARRVTKEQVLSLDKPQVIEVPINLDPEHHRLYKKLIRERFLEMGDEIINAINQQSLRMKSLQIITTPEHFTKAKLKNEVINGIDALLDSIGMHQEKVIIFANFQKSVEAIRDHLIKAKLNPATVYGGKGDNTKEVKRFLTDPTCRVMVANPESGGAGLNLQSVCSNVIFAEPTSVPGRFTQASNRVHRPGQKKVVTIYIVKALGTISPQLTKNMLGKEEAAKTITKDKESMLDELLGVVT
jgi:SNF2 family DNA or RNA helicase